MGHAYFFPLIIIFLINVIILAAKKETFFLFSRQRHRTPTRRKPRMSLGPQTYLAALPNPGTHTQGRVGGRGRMAGEGVSRTNVSHARVTLWVWIVALCAPYGT